MELIYLVISIVGVTIAGMEVVLSFQRVFCADSSLSTGDRQVLQAKLPVPLCITKNCVILYNTCRYVLILRHNVANALFLCRLAHHQIWRRRQPHRDTCNGYICQLGLSLRASTTGRIEWTRLQINEINEVDNVNSVVQIS